MTVLCSTCPSYPQRQRDVAVEPEHDGGWTVHCSRTGKAAEADLMILIGKSPTVEGQEEDSPLRHINIVKNKLNGWHGMVNCELDYLTARYEG